MSPLLSLIAAGSASCRGGRWSHGGGYGSHVRRWWRCRVCGRVSATQPTKPIALRILGCKSRLFAQQLHCQNVSRYHDNHGNVECDQGAEHEECPVIDDAYSRPRHDVRGINYAWNHNRRDLVTPWLSSSLISCRLKLSITRQASRNFFPKRVVPSNRHLVTIVLYLAKYLIVNWNKFYFDKSYSEYL